MTRVLEKYLSDYSPASQAQREVKSLFLDFIERSPRCLLRENLEGHITASALLLNFDGTRTLLTHHKKLGKWMQLGGHADGEGDVLKVAKKEAQEESGITHIEPLSSAIIDLDIHPIPESAKAPKHLHYDIRFILKVTDPNEEKFSISEESLDLKWCSPQEVRELSSEESLLRLVSVWEQGA